MDAEALFAPDPFKPRAPEGHDPYSWLLIDGGGLAVTAWATHKHLETPELRVKAALYIFVTSLASLSRLVRQDARIVVAWDGDDNRRWRRGVHPWYKHGRGSVVNRKEVGTVSALADELLRAIGAWTVKIDGREADDLVATLAHRITDGPVLIFSDDRDYLQAVDETVHLCRRSMKGIILSPGQCEVMDIVYGDQYLAIKALMGDAGDNIPGLKGIGEVKALELVRADPDVLHTARSDPDMVDWSRVKEATVRAFARAGRRLVHPCPPDSASLEQCRAAARRAGWEFCEHDHEESFCLEAALREAVRCLDLVTLDYEAEMPEPSFPEPNVDRIPAVLRKIGLSDETDVLSSLYRLAGAASSRQPAARTSVERAGSAINESPARDFNWDGSPR